MPTDLQAALEWEPLPEMLNGVALPRKHYDVLVDAARLVANPNIDAFLSSLWAHGADVLDWNKRQAIENVAIQALAAALTPRDAK